MFSVALDWRFARHVDLYAGVAWSQKQGGLANGFVLSNNNGAITAHIFVQANQSNSAERARSKPNSREASRPRPARMMIIPNGSIELPISAIRLTSAIIRYVRQAAFANNRQSSEDGVPAGPILLLKLTEPY
jgi:hypothetical protein